MVRPQFKERKPRDEYKVAAYKRYGGPGLRIKKTKPVRKKFDKKDFKKGKYGGGSSGSKKPFKKYSGGGYKGGSGGKKYGKPSSGGGCYFVLALLFVVSASIVTIF